MNIAEIKKLIRKVVSESGPIVQETAGSKFTRDTDKFIDNIRKIKDKYFSKKDNINKHSVKKGETLSKIAKRKGVSLRDLIKANPQIKNPDLIHVGDEINIPDEGTTKDTREPTKDTREPTKDTKQINTDSSEVAKYINWEHRIHKRRFLANKDIWPAVVRAADKYDLDRSFLLAMIHTESRFNRMAESPRNARGLIQIIPGTWEDLGGGDPFDTERNIELGAKYIRQILDWVPRRIRSLPNANDLKYSDEHIALTAYHTGMGRTRRVIRRSGNAGYKALHSVNPDMKYRYADKTLDRQKRYEVADTAVV